MSFGPQSFGRSSFGSSFGYRQDPLDNFRLAPPTLGIPTSRRPQSASPRLQTARAAPCNLAATWQQPFKTWEQQAQRSAQGATRPRSAKPRPNTTAFVANDQGHILPGSPRSSSRPSTARAAFSPRETYPWRTSLPLPSSLDWGESTPRGMRFDEASGVRSFARAPTPWRADSAGASRWPDAAHFATGFTQAPSTTAGPKQAAGFQQTEAARQLAAIIRPACVARCMSPRG